MISISNFRKPVFCLCLMCSFSQSFGQSLPFSAVIGAAGARRFDPKSNYLGWAELDLALRIRLFGEPFAFGAGFWGQTDKPFSDLISSPANIPKIILDSDGAAGFFLVSEFDIKIGELPKPPEISTGGNLIVPSFEGTALFVRVETYFTYIDVGDTGIAIIKSEDRQPFVDVNLLGGLAFSDGLHSLRIRLGAGTNSLLDRAFMLETGFQGFFERLQDLRFLWSLNWTSPEIPSLESRAFVSIGGSSPFNRTASLKNNPSITADRDPEMFIAIGMGWDLVGIFSNGK